VIHSGRERYHVPGIDIRRFWGAGASNVHWVIVTDSDPVHRALVRNAPDYVREDLFRLIAHLGERYLSRQHQDTKDIKMREDPSCPPCHRVVI